VSQPPRLRQLSPESLGEYLETELDLARRAFGPISERGRATRTATLRDAASNGRYFGIVDGRTLAASALYYDLRQWWHGRAMPAAGVASVKVAPEHRGRGIGRELMTGLLAEIEQAGYPLAVLYPATAPLYRSVGWELAGGQYQVCFPARSLRSLLPPQFPAAAAGSAPRRAGPGDAAQVTEVLSRAHQLSGDCGPATFDADWTRRWLDDPDLFAYLAGDGFAAYYWADGTAEIYAECVLAASAAGTRALWSVVGSHGSIARSLRACVPPSDPVCWLTSEPDPRPARTESWMLRIVDGQAAIAARGFPAGLAAAARLQIEDPQLAGNSGSWELQVSDGAGKLTPASGGGPGRTGAVQLGARGFAALFAGVPMATLRRAGLAAGGTAADPDLDAAFAAQPYLLQFF
jgi:predicted acetyltransferase